MSKRWIKAGATQQSIDLFILDSSSTTGAGLTGLSSSSSGLVCYYRKGITGSAQQLTLSTAGTIGTAWTTGGNFIAADGTNMPGVYRLDLLNSMVDTAGMLTIMLRGATNMAPVVAELEIVSVDIYDSTRFGLTALPNAAAEASGGLITRGTGSGQLSVTSGAVTVGTNNDKTGYSLTQSFPTNFSSLAITAGGAVTAGTVSDKTGYSLSAGSITSGTFGADAITASALASGAVNEIADAIWGSNISTNSSGTSWGGNTFGNRSLRTTSGAAYEVQVTNNNHISASVHDMQAGTITAASIAAGAIDANAIAANAIDASALAADAVSEIADGVWDEVLSGHLTAGTTGKALSDASTGGGGGSGSTTVRMGPFVIKAEGQGSDEPLDINKGATHAIECQLVDAEGTGVDITGATLTAKVYNSAGSLVETVSGTISYAALGQVRWTIGTTTTNTAGTYTVTITRTTGASDTQIFGPLRVYVRDI